MISVVQGGSGRLWRRLALCLVLTGLVFLAAPARVWAATPFEQYPVIKTFFPSADHSGAMEGTPPAAAVYHGATLLGYVFRTALVAPIPAYSGKPIDILIGINTKGVITGTKVLEQHEPILLVGLPVQKLYDFVAQYIGHPVTDTFVVGGAKDERPGHIRVDAISSATVTALVTNRTITDSALKVAVSRHLVAASALTGQPKAIVRRDLYQPADWSKLLGDGSIRHLTLSAAEVDKAFPGHRGEVKRDLTPQSTFIDLYYAYLNAPSIGRNLLGKQRYDELMASLKPDEHAILVLANGAYSFKGSGYARGGIFDRLHLSQDGNLILFHDLDYQDQQSLAAVSAPSFNEGAVFIIRAAYGFDPGRPWTLQLLVRRQIGPVKSIFTTFSGGYEIPDALVIHPAPPVEVPLWLQEWQSHRLELIILGVALPLLTTILMLQDILVRRPFFVLYARTLFQIFTLVYIGWYALGQLSVVNVLTFANAVIHGFRWETFLIDPVLFVMWAYVAATLLLWGRGVFCGWLCPFGALQKLTSQLARWIGVPQLRLPTALHERLWAIKYMILLALFGLSLQSTSMAERYAEVEPFKTAISLHFDRHWPFVLYAAGLVLISAFNQKFYCKYLCPLGAALAIPARLRLFDWLRRRPDCGHPCHLCARECEIQAIHDDGVINPNECHHCLDCQVTYWNDQRCPPLVQARKRRERQSKPADTQD